LRNVDYTSHKSLLRTDEFQSQHIPAEARTLAKKSSRVLHPFFLGSSMRSAKDNYSTWGHAKEIVDETSNRLERIFSLAMQLKADSILHPNNYRWSYIHQVQSVKKV
jgi:hypothetical protein